MIPDRPTGPLTVAVSDCLLGSRVRYDGAHKRSGLCHDELSDVFLLRGVCPEVGIGMPVPRDPIHLVGSWSTPRAVGIDDPELDFTDALDAFGARTASQLSDVSGHIFVRNSPSCGLLDVKVSAAPGAPSNPASRAAGRGIYAAAIARALPNLPLAQNDSLEDRKLRENFIMRTFVYAHWQRFLQAGLTAQGLIAFHSVYKTLVMAHSVASYRRLGRALAGLSADLDAVAQDYGAGLMQALTVPATRSGHANALSHLQGYLKREVSSSERSALTTAIERYRLGELPLSVPQSLLRRQLELQGEGYLLSQAYFTPFPGAAD